MPKTKIEIFRIPDGSSYQMEGKNTWEKLKGSLESNIIKYAGVTTLMLVWQMSEGVNFSYIMQSGSDYSILSKEISASILNAFKNRL